MEFRCDAALACPIRRKHCHRTVHTRRRAEHRDLGGDVELEAVEVVLLDRRLRKRPRLRLLRFSKVGAAPQEDRCGSRPSTLESPLAMRSGDRCYATASSCGRGA
eukprot:5289747-Pleurochrysis_carterae.AAC.1